MKRNPEIGDVVQIGNSKKYQLVISVDNATQQRSSDNTKDFYPYFLFVTIPYEVGTSVDPKQKTYLVSSCITPAANETLVKVDDIVFITQVKFKEKLSRTFIVK